MLAAVFAKKKEAVCSADESMDGARVQVMSVRY